MNYTNNKLEIITKFSLSLGQTCLLIIEDNDEFEQKINELIPSLDNLNYVLAKDYIDIMDALSRNTERIVYIEKFERLDSSVLEIIAEFEAGIVSLADRKNSTGLKIAKWNPKKISFLIIMTRKQVENSYSNLFNNFNIVQPL